MMSDATVVVEALMTKAKNHEMNNEYEIALFYYSDANDVIVDASLKGFTSCQMENNAVLTSNKVAELRGKIKHTDVDEGVKVQIGDGLSVSETDLQCAKFLCSTAAEEAESTCQVDKALHMYEQAVNILKAVKSTSIDEKILNITNEAIDTAVARIAELKQRADEGTGKMAPTLSEESQTSVEVDGLEPELVEASCIVAGVKYPATLDESVMHEDLALPGLYTDPDGTLALSEKQRKRFGRWARPSEFSKDPHMIIAMSPIAISQCSVGDCSVVSSLTVVARYEKMFAKSILTSRMFPQGSQKVPVYNPCGKYALNVYFNGFNRKVIIDDFIPIGKAGRIICASSINRNELWVSLFEKAYIKLMGGYTFRGSNSTIDLYVLAGWLPEKVNLQAMEGATATADREKLFKKLAKNFNNGACIATIGTRAFNAQQMERLGLANRHAYAILDVKEVLGHQLLRLKNPWRQMRWKGRFSENDAESWTPELTNALKYNVQKAQMSDNGVFWIDWQSACAHFKLLNLSWNPSRFAHVVRRHGVWQGRVADASGDAGSNAFAASSSGSGGTGGGKWPPTVADCPQYRVTVDGAGAEGYTLWLLLERHIHEKEVFGESKKQITLLVFSNTKTRKVYHVEDETHVCWENEFPNSPHHLVKLRQPPNAPAPDSYHAVVTHALSPQESLHYTLSAFCTAPVLVTRVAEPELPHTARIISKWTKQTAGGSKKHSGSFGTNPKLLLRIDSSAALTTFELRANPNFNVGFDVVHLAGLFPTMESPHKKGLSLIEVPDLPAGDYHIIPSTKLPGKITEFQLTVKSSVPISLQG